MKKSNENYKLTKDDYLRYAVRLAHLVSVMILFSIAALDALY